MPMKWLVNLTFRRCESPEETRKRRLCRKMLELPPEIQYSHVWPGLITLSGLSALLVGLVAWRLDALMTIAWGLAAIVALGALAAVCARIHQHYCHVAAGVLVLGALLALLAVTVHQQGYLDQVDALGSLDRSALNDSNSSR
jgi:cytochrome b